MIPRELELDLFGGDCWVGLAPFLITDLTAPRGPDLPWLSRFPGTNVRVSPAPDMIRYSSVRIIGRPATSRIAIPPGAGIASPRLWNSSLRPDFACTQSGEAHC
jgi:uncharacterized protein YqjF (DUF2071 family)